MNKKALLAGCFIAIISLLLSFQIVLAHESVTVGEYEIEVGWLNEPAIAGQQNAIVIGIVNTQSGEPVEDVAQLTLALSYGGQTKTLDLQPLGEDTPGQFMAPVIPAIPGEYAVMFGGVLGETQVDAETHMDEVQPVDVLQFPHVEAAPTATDTGSAGWLAWLGVLLGLIGIGVGIAALRRTTKL